MGQLVDGVWLKGWYDPDAGGAFKRPKTVFRSWIRKPSSTSTSPPKMKSTEKFVAEPGRYHLYAAYACPWAQRALITRALRKLEDVIDVTIVDPKMGDDGWVFGGLGEQDPLMDAKRLRDVYLAADEHYTGRVTVPVVWDKKTKSIVNNESRDVMRMLDTEFDELAGNPTSLVPPALRKQIDEMLDSIYEPYNNGVYRAGFATKQEAYDEACRDVFATLDRAESILSKQRYLCGSVLTEADIAMFTTSIRFDLVYYSHFKLNVRRLADYPNVWSYVRDIYQMPAVKQTCNFEHIKVHYYWSQPTVNPHRIVPLGPTIDFDEPHDRARFES